MPPSRWADIEGPIHYVDFGGPDDGPRLVLVHGLGGSLVSWSALAPALTSVGRVIAVDLPGFGRSPGSPRPVTLPANRKVLRRFVTQVTGSPVIIVGHSMGGTIAAMLAVQHSALAAGLIFVDLAMARPVDQEAEVSAMSRLSDLIQASIPRQGGEVQGKEVLQQMLRRVRAGYGRAISVSPQTIERNLAVIRARIESGQVNGDMLAAAQSLTLTVGNRRQFYSMLRQIPQPVLMLHGARDRFVSAKAAVAAARANPDWRLRIARDVGHWPHIEAPEWTAGCILDWLGADGAKAAELARRSGPSAG